MENALTLYYDDVEIREVQIDNQNWISLIDVARALGYKNPSRDAKQLVERNEHRFKNKLKKASLKTKGGIQDTLVLNLKGVLMFCMISQTDKAIPFQEWAVDELSKVINKIPSNIELRIKRTRVEFTNELKEHGIDKKHHYINITRSMKKNVGLDPMINKDKFDLIEKLKIESSENIARINLMQTNAIGYVEVKPICDDASKAVLLATDKQEKLI